MNSPVGLTDGAPVGRDNSASAAGARRTSNSFGSPGADSTVKRIDLNDALIRNPDATFVMRAAGNAMYDSGIADGDDLLVDRSVTAAHGAVVIAVVGGEMMCRRLDVSGVTRGGGAGRRVQLTAAEATTAPIEVTEASPLEVWGVVTTVIKVLAF